MSLLFVYRSPSYLWRSPCTSIHLLFGVPICWLYCLALNTDREKQKQSLSPSCTPFWFKKHPIDEPTTRNYASASLVPRCRPSNAPAHFPCHWWSGNETKRKPPGSHTRKVRLGTRLYQLASCPRFLVLGAVFTEIRKIPWYAPRH